MTRFDAEALPRNPTTNKYPRSPGWSQPVRRRKRADRKHKNTAHICEQLPGRSTLYRISVLLLAITKQSHLLGEFKTKHIIDPGTCEQWCMFTKRDSNRTRPEALLLRAAPTTGQRANRRRAMHDSLPLEQNATGLILIVCPILTAAETRVRERHVRRRMTSYIPAATVAR